MGRFGKEAVYIVSEHGFQSECDAAGAAAHSAGQVGEQGVLLVNGDLFFLKLFFETQGGDGVAEKQRF